MSRIDTDIVSEFASQVPDGWVVIDCHEDRHGHKHATVQPAGGDPHQRRYICHVNPLSPDPRLVEMALHGKPAEQLEALEALSDTRPSLDELDELTTYARNQGTEAGRELIRVLTRAAFRKDAE
jgi:hypothetical protein